MKLKNEIATINTKLSFYETSMNSAEIEEFNEKYKGKLKKYKDKNASISEEIVKNYNKLKEDTQNKVTGFEKKFPKEADSYGLTSLKNSLDHNIAEAEKLIMSAETVQGPASCKNKKKRINQLTTRANDTAQRLRSEKISLSLEGIFLHSDQRATRA